MNKLTITSIAAAIALAFSVGATGATMTKSDYKVAKDQISATYKSDKAACKAMTGNAKDICVEEAKGREKVGKAELEANFKPTDKSMYNVRLAKADAAYAVAKEKCDDAAGNAKDVCVKQAKAAYVTAKADAKVAVKTAEVTATAREKKAEVNTTVREKTAAVRKDAAADKRDAEYSVAKEKCDALSGDAKSNCIKDAKARYGQS